MVVAITSVNRILPVLTIEEVSVVAAENRIVAAATFDGVDTGSAFQSIVAVGSGQRIVIAVAKESVAFRTTDETVVARSAAVGNVVRVIRSGYGIVAPLPINLVRQDSHELNSIKIESIRVGVAPNRDSLGIHLLDRRGPGGRVQSDTRPRIDVGDLVGSRSSEHDIELGFIAADLNNIVTRTAIDGVSPGPPLSVSP